MLGITYFDGIVQILSLIVRKTSEIWFSKSVSHCTEKHNMDLNAWYKPPNVGFQWGNIILSIGTTLKQIWDHFMIWLHHHNITSKNCKCRTVGQRSSTVQCDIVPPWYLGIIVSILMVEKHLSKTILDKFHLFFYLWKVQNGVFSIRPYSVTCRFFLAFLLLDKKAWEVAQHVFCYCFDIN